MPRSDPSRSSGGTHSREKYVARACEACRRGKIKCDGQQPTCRSCSQAHRSCSYETGQDARRAVAPSYVKALKDRISVLETLLSEVMPNWSDTTQLQTMESGRDAVPVQAGPSASAETRSQDHFKLDKETQELQHYGPTSALQYLSGPDDTHQILSSNVILNTRYNPWTRTISVVNEPQGLVMIEWRRHLPPLPDWDTALHDQLIDLFFQCFAPYFTCVDSIFKDGLFDCLGFPTILNTAYNHRKRTSSYSPVLHNAILAISCQYSDDPRASNEEVGALLLRAAQHELFAEGDRPSLSTIQGTLLMSQYFLCNGKHGLGYFYAGIALRMSQILGLSQDCVAHVQRGLISEADRQARIKTFWSCYLHDKLWSTYIGHEPTLSTMRPTVELPLIDADQDAQPWPDSNKRLGYLSSTFHNISHLAMLQVEIVATMYGSSPSDIYAPTIINRVLSLASQLDEWFNALPDALAVAHQAVTPPPPHIITLNIYYYSLILLLHRSYMSESKTSHPLFQQARKRCEGAITRILSLLQLFDQAPGLRFAPPCLVQFLCTACTTALTRALNTRRLVYKESESNPGEPVTPVADRCIALLTRMGRPHRHALQHVEALRRMLSNATRSQETEFDQNWVENSRTACASRQNQETAFPEPFEDLFDPFDYIDPFREKHVGDIALMDNQS